MNCIGTSDTDLTVSWTEATVTSDNCNRAEGAIDIANYLVDVKRYDQRENSLELSLSQLSGYPRNVNYPETTTSAGGLGTDFLLI